MARAPPVIDFAPFYQGPREARQHLTAEIRGACEELGFFQLRNHGIPAELQDRVLQQSKALFSLPQEVKEKYDRGKTASTADTNVYGPRTSSQRTKGDLKEGFFLGRDLPLDDPAGPNKYPGEVADPALFRATVDEYYDAVLGLAVNIMTVIADMVGLDRPSLNRLCERPIATLRLLHYPPQPPDASELERGIGAHSDFGAITILLQDATGGLQVWNREAIPGAVVMRWTNDRYISNLFSFDGNADFVVECLDSCRAAGEAGQTPAHHGGRVDDRAVRGYVRGRPRHGGDGPGGFG
ncbi:Clavaminate synthase-like protein [Aspergillus ellipticus CBS 707.79]|uniref:Clavaminate synthase-like protein n=1 Tax=Aspergillus ellipticus CBS 707.79 TaxID=1448320 RepID=A0A319DBF8_9EURO|nr:Clavaminate synthase-like protein [Aspergillus ellipticus CBS 707.79]